MQKEKRIKSRLVASIFALIIMAGSASLLSGCSDRTPETEPTQSVTAASTPYSPPKTEDIHCDPVKAYSGVFAEDGKKTEVKDVASVLVENRSQTFLDRAIIKYKYGDKTATFVVTGLPAGKKCRVLEASKIQMDTKQDKKQDKKTEFVFEDCICTFKEDALLVTDKVSVVAKDKSVEIKNTSMKTLKNICVYYKNTDSDGTYIGGITYMIVANSLKPGDSLTKPSSNFSESSEIVRYSFLEE